MSPASDPARASTGAFTTQAKVDALTPDARFRFARLAEQFVWDSTHATTMGRPDAADAYSDCAARLRGLLGGAA